MCRINFLKKTSQVRPLDYCVLVGLQVAVEIKCANTRRKCKKCGFLSIIFEHFVNNSFLSCPQHHHYCGNVKLHCMKAETFYLLSIVNRRSLMKGKKANLEKLLRNFIDIVLLQ